MSCVLFTVAQAPFSAIIQVRAGGKAGVPCPGLRGNGAQKRQAQVLAQSAYLEIRGQPTRYAGLSRVEPPKSLLGSVWSHLFYVQPVVVANGRRWYLSLNQVWTSTKGKQQRRPLEHDEGSPISQPEERRKRQSTIPVDSSEERQECEYAYTTHVSSITIALLPHAAPTVRLPLSTVAARSPFCLSAWRERSWPF